MATLKDIARHLDLSITQVSRALNDHSDVNAETRERVKETARALQYQPNMSARKLVSGRSGMVGLVVSQAMDRGADGIFLETIAGLSTQFSGRGMQFVLHMMQDSEKVLQVYRKLIGKGALDGFVLIDPFDGDPRIAFLQDENIPFVLHGRTAPNVDYPFFDIDNERLSYELTRHLIAQGHRRIAQISGVAGRTYVSARSRGYSRALAEAGIREEPSFSQFGVMDEAHGLVSTIKLCADPVKRPTGIICGSVRIAKGVYQALDSLHLPIPSAMSVVAHDDHLPHLRASAFFPSLTVTKAPLRDSWEPLADFLAGAIDGVPLAELQRVGPHEFISRNSVAPASISD